MILQISADAKELIRFSDEPLSQYQKKKLAKTSKTGLKLHQKLLLIPSPERTGYRKSYLDGLLKGSCLRWKSSSPGGRELSQVEESGLRWRGAVSGGGELSQVELSTV